jgi:hypothetical protein
MRLIFLPKKNALPLFLTARKTRRVEEVALKFDRFAGVDCEGPRNQLIFMSVPVDSDRSHLPIFSYCGVYSPNFGAARGGGYDRSWSRLPF